MSKTQIDRYYRPELDALRFFAFLSVFTVHRMDHLPIAATLLFLLSFLGTPARHLPGIIIYIYLGRISYGLYLFHELVYTLISHRWKNCSSH